MNQFNLTRLCSSLNMLLGAFIMFYSVILTKAAVLLPIVVVFMFVSVNIVMHLEWPFNCRYKSASNYTKYDLL